jgi:hypothetical protein
MSFLAALFACAWSAQAAPVSVHSFDTVLAEGKSLVIAGQTMYLMLDNASGTPTL